MIPVVIRALGTITKELVQGLEDSEIRGPVETIQATALLRTTRIRRRVGDLLSLGLLWKTISNARVKNAQMSKQIIFDNDIDDRENVSKLGNC